MPFTQLESKLIAAASQRSQSMIDDLRTLVNIPTGPGSTGLDETRERLTSRLSKIGAAIQMVDGDARPAWIDFSQTQSGSTVAPPTAIARRRREGGEIHLLLGGHIDTVHHVNSDFRAMTMSSDGLKIMGPGAVDMKGGLLVAINALEVLEECGVDASWSFAINSDEETGSYHSDRALRAEASTASFGLVFEPAMTNGGLVVERGGSAQFMIETRGINAHVGRDFTSGRSAVNALAASILHVGGLADPSRGLITNVGPLFCDQPPNVVPDLARAWGNGRFSSPELAEELRARLEDMNTSEMPSVSVVHSFNRPSKPSNDRVMALAMAARGVSEDLGRPLPFGSTAGVCDGNNFQAVGLPTIDTLGVRGGGLHTPDEWVETASLVERTQLTAVLISRLVSGQSR